MGYFIGIIINDADHDDRLNCEDSTFLQCKTIEFCDLVFTIYLWCILVYTRKRR